VLQSGIGGIGRSPLVTHAAAPAFAKLITACTASVIDSDRVCVLARIKIQEKYLHQNWPHKLAHVSDDLRANLVRESNIGLRLKKKREKGKY
jgi:hypothetical protein